MDILQKVIEVIIETTKPEKVYLIGTLRCVNQGSCIFTKAPVASEPVLSLNFLILTSDETAYKQLRKTVEYRCRATLPITALVLRLQKFNHLLEAGHPFALTIMNSHSMVFDARNDCLSKVKVQENILWSKQIAEEMQRAYQLASPFLW